MRHAIASASIENLQSDERTRGWFLEFAHGRLSEEEGIERIKADL
ncbi:hypothetical protein [Magnetospirillum sp. ME-1]|nr:hypothetical protein [Magnetospirillum sp. ME-1]